MSSETTGYNLEVINRLYLLNKGATNSKICLLELTNSRLFLGAIRSKLGKTRPCAWMHRARAHT